MPARRAKFGHLGWRPDLPDVRDKVFRSPISRLATLPDKVDMRPKMPPVYAQDEIGSCTANATAAAFQYERRKEKDTPDFVPSRLFEYYNTRVMEGTPNEDSGASIRDAVRASAIYGMPDEALYPYDIRKFTQKPPQSVYDAALGFKTSVFDRVSQNLRELQGCLASDWPIVFGFTVFDSFDTDAVAKSGVMPMPNPAKEDQVGGHAVLAVGYDNAQSAFIIRNSWSADWGQAGYFMMPYAFITNAGYCDDFWRVSATGA